MTDYEPLSPLDVEAKLRGLVNDMSAAQKALREARDAETNAEIAYKRARARAFHSQDVPHVTRGGTTTGERDAWIDEQVMDEWSVFRLATTGREVAQDRLRVVLAIAETVRSLGASVRTAYTLAGTS